MEYDNNHFIIASRAHSLQFWLLGTYASFILKYIFDTF
jgi:hypothetical protein